MKEVNKCICFDVLFSEIKASGFSSISEIKKEFKCCTKCKMCERYIKKMLITGETSFDSKNV